ncbi:transposase, partial [Tersicoccus phoenicis]
MHDRHDLTDDQWALLEPHLPGGEPARGGQWADH